METQWGRYDLRLWMEIMRLGGGFSGLDPHQAAAERRLQVGSEFNRSFGSTDFGSVYRVSCLADLLQQQYVFWCLLG